MINSEGTIGGPPRTVESLARLSSGRQYDKTVSAPAIALAGLTDPASPSVSGVRDPAPLRQSKERPKPGTLLDSWFATAEGLVGSQMSLLQQQRTVPAQVNSAADSRIRLIAVQSFPDDPVKLARITDVVLASEI